MHYTQLLVIICEYHFSFDMWQSCCVSRICKGDFDLTVVQWTSSSLLRGAARDQGPGHKVDACTLISNVYRRATYVPVYLFTNLFIYQYRNFVYKVNTIQPSTLYKTARFIGYHGCSYCRPTSDRYIYGTQF